MEASLANQATNLLLVGLNHRSAPVEIRERLAFGGGVLEGALRRLVDGEAVHEGVILSTCNRVEVIACAPDLERASEKIKTFLAEEHQVTRAFFESHLYTHIGKDAVNHLFRVTASLDSMVPGEPQVLGQVKAAYAVSSTLGTLGVILHRCFHKAFSVAKRVHTETRISARAVSVSSAAVDLVRSVFDRLIDKIVMVIGAGEMAEQAVRHLRDSGIGTVLVTNRTFQRAVELAHQCDGTVVPFERLYKHLPLSDVVIGAAGCKGHMVSVGMVEWALNKRKLRPILFIDLGVPRNFDPRLNDLENVFLYDIDDLEKVVEGNKGEREREALRAETIVTAEVEAFWSWLMNLEITPTILALREKAEAIRKRELEKTLAALQDLPSPAQKAIEALSTAITNKLLHPPIAYLKSSSRNGQGLEGASAEVVRRIYGLEEGEET
jgi:glutamyl-tRNA reductase